MQIDNPVIKRNSADGLVHDSGTFDYAVKS